ncbi:flagellar hook-basal body complex protein FliE [bacterium]|nr:MAG: flagellar hook-basal body complex protein FliE [bacterium]
MSAIDAFKQLPSIGSPFKIPESNPLTKESDSSFGDTLGKFISDVNKTQIDAADKTMKFASGEITDIHEVMAASEEATISLMLLLEMRKKALEGYQELMRTPV